MRLTHATPATLVGRTLIYRGQFWHVDQIEDSKIHLSKYCSKDRGLLRSDQLGDCRLYPSSQEVREKYPRLYRALRSACILTPGEAEACLVSHITTGPFAMSSEAVAHMGGSAAAIRQAIRCRHRVSAEARRQASH